MTENSQPIPVQLPFASLDQLKAALKPLLSSEGLFIETQYPPAQGATIDMTLVVGEARSPAARFVGQVSGTVPPNADLEGRNGVFIRFTQVPETTRDFFRAINPNFEASSSEGSASIAEEETLTLTDEEVAAHEQMVSQLSSAGETAQEENGEWDQRSLADDLLEFTQRPDSGTDGVVEFQDINPEGSSHGDDLSAFQGAEGYQMSDVILGIDLGTCNSCVSVVQDQEVMVLTDEKGNNTTPSVVSYLEDGHIITGREALAQVTTNSKQTIFGAKRFIGRRYNSSVVQKMIPFFPYKLVPDEENHTAININGNAVSLEQVSSEILKTMVSIGQTGINQETDKVIITVPAYYSDNQRQAVKDSGILAGLNVVRIVNEPTAAALAVGFNRHMQKRLLVYDLGGGTFDVSVLEIENNVFKVRATGGDTFLGGEDFDNRLVKWVLESSRDENIHLARNAVTFERLKQACEKAKCELSNKRDTAINLPYIQTKDGQTINFQKKISRENLVQLTRDLVERSLVICDQVLQEGQLTIADVDEIVLVGGMTRMPFAQNSVHQHYKKQPYGEVNPDEAVAMGAALLGGELTGSKSVDLVDVLSMSIGIALPRNRFKPILMKNSQVPCAKKYRISADLSSDFSIDIFQGNEANCDENEYLGTLVFSDEVKSASGQPLEIEFSLNPECLLSCTIRNPNSGKSEKALLVTHDTPPSSTQKMVG